MTPVVLLYPIGHAVVGQEPTQGSALLYSLMTHKIDPTSPIIFKNTFLISLIIKLNYFGLGYKGWYKKNPLKGPVFVNHSLSST